MKLPDFSPAARFGILNGKPVSEDKYDTREWPSGDRVSGMAFREDAERISKPEFERAVEAANAGS